MKKTYIIPDTIVVELTSSSAVLMGMSEGEAVNPGLAKENVDAGDDNTASGKNVWDEEW